MADDEIALKHIQGKFESDIALEMKRRIEGQHDPDAEAKALDRAVKSVVRTHLCSLHIWAGVADEADLTTEFPSFFDAGDAAEGKFLLSEVLVAQAKRDAAPAQYLEQLVEAIERSVAKARVNLAGEK